MNSFFSLFFKVNSRIITRTVSFVTKLYSDWKAMENPWYQFVCMFLLLLLSVPATLVYLAIILLVNLVLIVKQLVEYWFQPSPVQNNLSEIYPDTFIANLLCNILEKNFRIFNIIPPQNVESILPVRYPYRQSINGFSYYRFVVQHNDVENSDFSNMIELLNLKITQYLQANCYNLQTLFNGIPVIYVFNMEHCRFHQSHYAISIMLIDSDEKVKYINSLINQRKEIVPVPAMTDEDF